MLHMYLCLLPSWFLDYLSIFYKKTWTLHRLPQRCKLKFIIKLIVRLFVTVFAKKHLLLVVASVADFSRNFLRHLNARLLRHRFALLARDLNWNLKFGDKKYNQYWPKILYHYNTAVYSAVFSRLEFFSKCKIF
jgi:hypothetical protein